MKKYTFQDVLDKKCTIERYHSQFNPIQLKLNKTYVQAKGTWREKYYKIIFTETEFKLKINKLLEVLK